MWWNSNLMITLLLFDNDVMAVVVIQLFRVATDPGKVLK